MTLEVGTRLAAYEVAARLGAGGMGEVYRARDTRLDRDVALKVLPEAFTADPDRLARFQREAKVLASLNHPHIGHIYGLEEADGQRALVLELVEGLTLADRIAQGAIPLDEALPIAKQIAEALEAAHEQGIVHRDLKPANVKVKEDGTVKVLDFGLAKAFEPEAEAPDDSQSPTLSARATQAGVILGTAAYMAPEQARGKPVDKRADIWAFGCVLYEMLAGQRAFVGSDVTDTLASVLRSEPAWAALPASTPPGLQGLLQRCLEKEPRQRLRDIGEARIQLADEAPGSPPENPKRRRGVPWPAAAALVVAAVVATWLLRPVEPPPEAGLANLRLGLQPADRLREFHDIEYALSRRAFALSHDGRMLAFTSGSGKRPELYVRQLDEEEAVLIQGTSGAVGPFFSPDAQWMGFWADGELKKVRVEGGLPQRICDVVIPPNGATWSRDGTIFFGASAEGILRVSAAGGTPEAVTALEGDEGSHGLPHLLPGHDALLFTAGPVELKSDRVDRARLVVQSLGSGERKVLVENAADGRFVTTGHLVFLRLGTLMAAAFDPNRLELTGEPLAVRDGILQDVNAVFLNASKGAGQYSISSSGWLAYVPGKLARQPEAQLTWFTRDGASEPLEAPPGEYVYPRISPDGRRVAVNKDLSSIWLYDVPGRTWSRVTPAESTENMLVWSPGGEITYLSERSGAGRAVYAQAPETPGSAERLADGELLRPISWSPDGQVLALVRQSTDRTDDIWILPKNGEPEPFRESPTRLWWPEFSPDGTWLAYAASAPADSVRYEVYVEPFPGPGPRIQITADGGSPTWARGGEELFYARFTEGDPFGMTEMWSVRLTKDGAALRAGRPRLLFRTRMNTTAVTRGFDVTPDGETFLVVVQEEREIRDVTEIHVVVNWVAELERLVPVE